jgi:hypothetical protein
MDGILRCKVIEIPLKMGMESGTYVGKNWKRKMKYAEPFICLVE